jgi:hypothetical protein
MGGTSSKTLVDIVNESSAEVITRNMQSCSSSINQTQVYNMTGFSYGFNASQDASINMSCVANFKMNDQIATQITNDVIQKATASSVALISVSKTKAEAESHIKNSIKNNVTTELVQKSVASISQSQYVNVSGVQINSNISQSAASVQKAIMTAISNTNIKNDLATVAAQSSSAEQKNPLSFISDIFKNIYMVFFLIFIVIIVVIGGGLYLIFK